MIDFTQPITMQLWEIVLVVGVLGCGMIGFMGAWLWQIAFGHRKIIEDTSSLWAETLNKL